LTGNTPCEGRTPAMKISIIGDGNVGSALARGLQKSGHSISMTGNDPAHVAELAASGEIIILAVPFGAHDQVAATIGSAANAKPVVDVSNALTSDLKLALGYTTSAAEELQKKLPSAKVVKAFNTVFAGTMDSGRAKGEQLTTFVTGDDAAAKSAVLDLARGIGFDAVDAGPLVNARLLEPVGFLTIQLAYVLGLGPEIGIKLVH
jgi:8-hydroxy-5-deazaflavin:NADPH oxidoreductase